MGEGYLNKANSGPAKKISWGDTSLSLTALLEPQRNQSSSRESVVSLDHARVRPLPTTQAHSWRVSYMLSCLRDVLPTYCLLTLLQVFLPPGSPVSQVVLSPGTHSCLPPRCPTYRLSCFQVALPPGSPASRLPCLQVVLHPSCPASPSVYPTLAKY